MTELRASLTGADKAVSEVLDEINVRMHGLISGGSYHREFLDWLAERGYEVTPLPVLSPLAADLLAEARGPRPVAPGDRVHWEDDQLTYDEVLGAFVPTGVVLHFRGEVRRVEVDYQNFPDQWTAYVMDSDGRPHALDAARLLPDD